ncbi:MAG: 5'-nucleotidase C-terminal domain-containing protein [Thiogranum sp.]|nr:5'-nucleotidase C-terminal domain-containing protein [Thiogranum sp.]
MKHNHAMKSLLLASSLAALALGSSSASADYRKPRSESTTITLMQLQDVHGHIHAHAEIFPDGRKDAHSGGLAKLTMLIRQVREENPNNLLLAIGDTTHGSTEATFSLGDVLMPWLNSLDIDAFTPGNWDFGYGPRVYRQRFTADTNIQLAPNNRTTIAWMDSMLGNTCNVPGGLNATTYASCHVTKATFPTVAMNVYNYNEVAGATNPAQPLGPLVHAPYLIKEVNGVKVAILGLTSDVVPQQAQAFNTGLRFTMGYKELPENIAAVQAAGANVIVVLSELGLAKNVQLVKEFPEINVMFSGHTHERTPEEIIIEHKGNWKNPYSIVTEAGEDSFLGRLDLEVDSRGRIISHDWDLMEADSSVEEDAEVEAYVDNYRKYFVSGPDLQCHTFGTNAFPFGKGHTICDPMDTVVGHTDVTIQRWNVLEDVSNNVMVDAFLDLAQNVGELDSKGNPLSDANSLSTTNGFRFDIVVFGDGEVLSDGSTANGDITLEDLYDYYPIGAAVALAEFTGGRLKQHWEGVLSNVFDPNPYRQRGGWFLGFTHNMHFDVRLNDDFPQTISAGKRITGLSIDGQKLDDSKVYTLASCYPHGNAVDEVCRTTGATNVRFIQGVQENCANPVSFAGGIQNCQLDVSNDANFTVVQPVNSENIWDPVRFAGGGPLFRQVAPDNFVHPVDALRRYLASHSINLADHGLGRVNAVDGVPVSEHGDAGIVQPTQGAGPAWMAREFINQLWSW